MKQKLWIFCVGLSKLVFKMVGNIPFTVTDDRSILVKVDIR